MAFIFPPPVSENEPVNLFAMKDNSNSCFQKFSTALLILINLGFLTVGILLIYFAASVSNSQWVQIFSESYYWIADTTMYVMMGFGAVTIFIALFGCIGSWKQNRCLLIAYMVFVIAGLIVFVIITAAAFTTMAVSNDWKTNDQQATEKEVSLSKNFDKAYCYSQAVYYCNSGPVVDAKKIFMPDLNIPDDLIKDYNGLNSVCELGNIGALFPSVQPFCDVCADSSKYEGFEQIFIWAKDECPLTPEHGDVGAFCFQMVTQSGSSSNATYDTGFAGKPYGLCQEPVLSLVGKWTFRVGLGATIVSSACVLLIVAVCALLRKKKHNIDHYNEAAAA